MLYEPMANKSFPQQKRLLALQQRALALLEQGQISHNEYSQVFDHVEDSDLRYLEIYMTAAQNRT